MAPRAIWKGSLKVGEVACPISLYTAASTSDRMAFHTINRETGHRVSRVFVDTETGKPVEKEQQVKGYEVADGDYVILQPEEITEPRRVCRRLQLLSRMEHHEQDDEQVFP